VELNVAAAMSPQQCRRNGGPVIDKTIVLQGALGHGVNQAGAEGHSWGNLSQQDARSGDQGRSS
jgi:hypothetical protein